MRKAEALHLVGLRVRAWTPANGVYIGIVEAIHGSPWRAGVRVTAVIEPAHHLEQGRLCRRGFRPGETLDVGGASIQPLSTCQVEGHDYMGALLAQRQRCEAQARKAADGPNDWVWPAMMLALDAAVEAEARRLSGQPWELRCSRGRSSSA